MMKTFLQVQSELDILYKPSVNFFVCLIKVFGEKKRETPKL